MKERFKETGAWIMGEARDLLFPPRCPGCDALLKEAELRRGFCMKCFSRLEYAKEPVCKVCGSVLGDGEKELCTDCEKRPHFFVQSRSAYVYYGPVKHAMYRFKFGNRRCLARTFADDLVRMYGPWLGSVNVDAVVHVPMHAAKKKRRGYDQAEVLAKELSRRIRRPFVPDAVCRFRPTEAQKGLNEKQRRKNLKRAFKRGKNSVQSKRILLVDDIYTTGATMDAVSEVLISEGVSEIYGMTAAVGKDL